tara:strand:- start:18987 stop:19832 length:846 start_codon:yes stop_codon:yes gene_type:complete
MRRIIILLLSGLMLYSFCFAAVPIPVNLKAPSSTYVSQIKKRGYLRVGLYGQNYPPFVMYDKSHKPYGLDVELAKQIAEYLGVAVKFDTSVEYYIDLNNHVAQEKYDIALSGVFMTPERAEVVNFSTPYMKTNTVLVTNRVAAIKHVSSPHVYTSFNNPKIKLGILKYSEFELLAKDYFPKAKEARVENVTDLFHQVATGKLTAMLVSAIEARYFIAHNPQFALSTEVLPISNATNLVSIMSSYGHPRFNVWLNTVVALLDANHVAEDLSQQYFVVKKDGQ